MDTTEVGKNIATAILVVIATIQSFRAKSATSKIETLQAQAAPSEDLAKKNAELASAHAKRADEWQKMWQDEHAESVQYHNYIHEKAKEDQALMATLSEENIRLKERTDLTPLVSHMHHVLEAITKLTATVDELMQRVGAKKHETA